ncbi:MAG: alpha amylase C-terminal domain-containing protein, partial [Roseicyclus sp.]
GDRWQKFANLRAYYGFMWGHPGKKLLFMGGEFGQEREWNHDQSLDWHLLHDPMHEGLRGFVRDLNALYRTEPGLHQRDCRPDGFAWIEMDDADNNVFSFLRFGEEGSRPVVVVSNMAPVPREGYRIGVPQGGTWVERLNSDAAEYGGSGAGNHAALTASEAPMHGQPASLALTLPPLATIFLTPE